METAKVTQLGRYRIIAELGRGAMGVVYKAQDTVLDRTVAIKTILMAAEEEERAEYERRFYQEAKAAGGLNHPSIITVHDIGREGDVTFMAMELLQGVDLRELMNRGRLPLPLALDIAIQVADGLAFAHEHGVVHRDIKPANIMVVRERYAKIMDFGIAQMRLSDVKTQTGAMLGSPKYMSPEQVNGERADHRSDIFSLAVTVFEMLTGQPPFSAADLGQLMYQIATAQAPAVSSLNPALPTTIDFALTKALQKAPDARYQDARDFAADLRSGIAMIETEAAFDATLKIDRGEVDETVVLPTGKGEVVGEAIRTQTLGATSSPGTMLHLSLSRRFDSAEAVKRLPSRQSAERPAQDLSTRVKRYLRDPDRRNLAKWILAAGVASLLVALA
jgi:serine/threonine protein kinase